MSRNEGLCVYSLMRSAADSIGREDFDITQYKSNLEKDWYSEEEQLRRPVTCQGTSQKNFTKNWRRARRMTTQIGRAINRSLGTTMPEGGFCRGNLMMMVVVVIPTQTICDLIVQEYRNTVTIRNLHVPLHST